MDTIPMNRLARVYLKIRTRIQELTKQYESEVEDLKAQQDEVKAAMKDQLMALGSKSVKTDQGTVILMTKTRYFTQDWDAFKIFMKSVFIKPTWLSFWKTILLLYPLV